MLTQGTADTCSSFEKATGKLLPLGLGRKKLSTELSNSNLCLPRSMRKPTISRHTCSGHMAPEMFLSNFLDILHFYYHMEECSNSYKMTLSLLPYTSDISNVFPVLKHYFLSVTLPSFLP
jgi:hypothetical protein